MGQQQLLLLVLGIVIVGLAVVVGINAFSENRIKSNADAMVTDGLRIASDVQAWALKPTQFGGGNDGQAGTGHGPLQALADCQTAGNDCFLSIGYTQNGPSDSYSNVNAQYHIGTTVTQAGDTACPTNPGELCGHRNRRYEC